MNRKLDMGKVLDLVLKHQWFDLIESGVKREEYREIKPFYERRFSRYSYDVVRFRRGYTKQTLLFQIESIKRGVGKPEWGAPPYPVFIISFKKTKKDD